MRTTHGATRSTAARMRLLFQRREILLGQSLRGTGSQCANRHEQIQLP